MYIHVITNLDILSMCYIVIFFHFLKHPPNPPPTPPPREKTHTHTHTKARLEIKPAPTTWRPKPQTNVPAAGDICYCEYKEEKE